MHAAALLRVSVALLSAILFAPHCAHAHGGALHSWNFNTPGYNYTRQLVATVSNFTFYDADKSASFLPGDIPYFPTYSSPAIATGSVTVWVYLDATCRVTGGLQPNLVFTSSANGAFIAHEKVYMWGMTGKCATGVIDTWKANATAGSNRGNMLWAGREAETDANGTYAGTSPNIFYPAVSSTAGSNAIASILVGFDSSVSPFLCADVVPANPSASEWAALVAACVPGGTGSPPGRRLRHTRLH